MKRGLLHFTATAALLNFGSACSGGSTADTQQAAPDVGAAANEAGRSTRVGEKGDQPSADTADDGAGAEASDKAEAGPAASGRQWVVWRKTDTGFRTRWVAEKDDGFELIADKAALVSARGDSLVHVKRDDHEVKVSTCSCMDDEVFEGDPCKTTGRINNPGLVAIDLDDGTTTPLIEAGKEDEFGEVYGRSLRIQGGVGDLLLVAENDSGYYCGAHQSIGGAVHVIELGGQQREVFKDLKAPVEVRKRAAAGETWKLYRDCEEPELDQAEFANKVLEVSSLSIGTQGGKLELTWGLEAFVPYACSPDYTVYGEGRSGLTKEAAALGLADPLPKALLAALADFGDARTVGWAQVKVEGERREHLLAKFNALGDEVWPPEDSEEKGVVHPPSGSPGQQLELGRKLTRDKNYTEAIAALDGAIAAEPSMHRAWAARGFAKLLAGDLDGAEADCSKAYELDDDPKFRGSIAYNLGLIAKKRGDLEGAKKHFKNSLGMRPNAIVQAALEELEGAPPTR